MSFIDPSHPGDPLAGGAPASEASGSLWQALPVGLLRLQGAGEVLAANEAARRLLLPAGGWPTGWGEEALLCGLADAEVLHQRLARSQDFNLLLPLEGLPRWIECHGVWQAATAGWPAHHLCVLRDASDDLRVQAQVREQTGRLQWLADQLPDPALYVDLQDGRCRVVNRRWAHAVRRPVDSLIGRRLDDLLGPAAVAALRPALDRVRLGQAAVLPWTFPVAGTGEALAPTALDLEFIPHRGEAGRVEGCLIAARARGADFDVTLPVSEPVLPPGQTRASGLDEGGWMRFVQSSSEGLVLQRDGVITEANPAFCRWVGLSPGELRGRSFAEFVPEAQQPEPAPSDDAALEHRREATLVGEHGERRFVELRERAWLQGQEALQMTVLRDLSAEVAAAAHIRRLSDQDSLTGLPNRPTFMKRLDDLAEEAGREGLPLALLFIDLDHFKRVNDLLGHPAGDALLRTVAARLMGHLRSTDLVARFGGDEFMVLLPGRLSARHVEEVARKLLTAIEQPVEGGGQVFQVTPSIGVALFPQDGASASELIKNADTAMYAAKARGRAGVAFYDRAMGSEAQQVLLIESQLTQALAQGELRMHLQPQVDATTGAPVGAEALIRWRHPERGWVPPDAFVPVAEQQRLIVPIGQWMLREAARAIRQGLDRSAPLGVIGVNLSASHFESDGFVEEVELLLQEEGIPGECLELELTERMLLEDLPLVLARLHRLRTLGIRIAVDDFGTGYSSLGHLKQFPVDKLKIDRLFVKDLPDNPESAAILRALVQMAHSLKIAVLVEGVETEAQRRFLAAEGVDSLQGHAIGRPLSLADYLAWVELDRQRRRLS